MILIDGSRLAELMIEFGVGVRVICIVEVKRLDEDFLTMEFSRFDGRIYQISTNSRLAANDPVADALQSIANP